MKILIVDDDPIVLESCEMVLQAEGFEVCLLPSADEALRELERAPASVLLVDIKMPVRDGFFVMEQVKGRYPQIPIVAMTGYPTSETMAECAKLGASRFLAKPFTPDELVNVLAKVTRKETRDG